MLCPNLVSRFRRINVTNFGDKSQCHVSVTSQKYYVVFAEKVGNTVVAKYDDLFGATADWSPENENRVWAGVGELLTVIFLILIAFR